MSKTDCFIVLFWQFLNISRAFFTNYQTNKQSRECLWSDVPVSCLFLTM